MIRIRNQQDFWAGLLFAVVGVAAWWIGRTYSFGTVVRMGPGFLPMVLSIALVGFGLFMSVRALTVDGPEIARAALRPQFFVLLAIVVFGLLIERVGLALCVAAVTLLAALAGSDLRVKEIALLAVGMAVLCVVLFIYLLGQPMPAFWF